MKVVELVQQHRRVAVDANVLIYVQDELEPMARIAGALLDFIEAGTVGGVMSVVGLAELAAGPARSGALAEVERIVDEVRSISGLHIQSVTAEIAVDAGIVRGMRGVAMPDALHIASARAVGATALVTNDRRLRSSPQLQVVYLDELELDQPAA